MSLSRLSFVGYESGRVEEDMESSSSNSGEKSYDGELSGSLELPEDYSDEVGKRLNQMVPIPVSFSCGIQSSYFTCYEICFCFLSQDGN